MAFYPNIFYVMFSQVIIYKIEVKESHLVASALPKKRKKVIEINSCFNNAPKLRVRLAKIVTKKENVTLKICSCLNNAHPVID